MNKTEIDALVALLRQPYRRWTSAERHALTSAMTALQAQLAAAVARAEAAESLLPRAWERGRDAAADWCGKKLDKAQKCADDAETLGAPIEMQRSWRAVISHLEECPPSIRALTPPADLTQEKPHE
jgi:hypothetical protein